MYFKERRALGSLKAKEAQVTAFASVVQCPYRFLWPIRLRLEGPFAIVVRGDPRGISPGGTPGKIVFLIPPFPGENFPIPRGKLNKKLPEKRDIFLCYLIIFHFLLHFWSFMISNMSNCNVIFKFWWIFSHFESVCWQRKIRPNFRWWKVNWKIIGKIFMFNGNIDVWCQD